MSFFMGEVYLRITFWTIVLFLSTGALGAQILQVDQAVDFSSGHFSYSIQADAPMGQSFTSSSNTIGFVQFEMIRGGPSVLSVNLRSNNISGPVIGRSRPLKVMPGTNAVLLFDFGTNVSITPGQRYALEPVFASGSNCTLRAYHWNYTNGEFIVQGKTNGNIMWFREGPVASFPSLGGLSPDLENVGQFHAVINGLSGVPLITESSVDGKSWTPIQTNVFTNVPMVLTWSNAVDLWRFYRVFYPTQ
ncbi:MAG: hypothetical protein JWM16_5174 [Verrucomicrobiales bacterium]|nr:hypothetical protein [Verrucomicrobiales bacterium]